MRCANPLFLKWVREFHAEKDYRIRGGPSRATGYENAIRALEHCTTKYDHPLELKVLSGVRPTCISRLIEKLEVHCECKGVPVPEYTPPQWGRKKAAAEQEKKAPAGSSTPEDDAPAKKRAPIKRQTKRKKQESEDEDDKNEDEKPDGRPEVQTKRQPKRKKAEDEGENEAETGLDAKPKATRRCITKAKPAEENEKPQFKLRATRARHVINVAPIEISDEEE